MYSSTNMKKITCNHAEIEVASDKYTPLKVDNSYPVVVTTKQA
jgi:hypothetical protein